MACWLKDPSMFVEYYDSTIKQWRLHENFNTPLDYGQDYSHVKNITDYLELVDHSFPWKESDCDAFKDFLYKYDIMVNCQGLVLSISFPRERERHNQPGVTSRIFRSLEVVDLSRFGLPAPSIPFREVQYLECRKSAPVESSPKENELDTKLTAIAKELDQQKADKKAHETEIAGLKEQLDKEKKANERHGDKKALEIEVSELKEQLNKEKEVKEALEKQVIDLKSTLQNCRGNLEPWMSYTTVLSDWVSYEGLVINQAFRRPSGRVYTLAETVETLDLNEDDTTNIQPKHFYRALMDGVEIMLELIVVKIDKLSPNNQKAKFKPDVWFKFDNAGETFAAREPTETETKF